MCPRVDAVEFVTDYFFRTQTCVRMLTLGLKKIAFVDVDWWGECISICSVTAEPYVANQIQFFCSRIYSNRCACLCPYKMRTCNL